MGYVPIMVELEVELSPLKLRGSWVSTICQTLSKSTRLWFWLSVIFFFKSRFFPLGVRKYFLYFLFCRHPQLRYLVFEKITWCFEFGEYFEEWELFEYNITVLYVVFLIRHVGTQTRNDRLCSNVMHFCVKGMWYEMSWIVLSSTWHTQEEGTSIKELSLSDSLMGMPRRHFPDCQQVQGYSAFWV